MPLDERLEEALPRIAATIHVDPEAALTAVMISARQRGRIRASLYVVGSILGLAAIVLVGNRLATRTSHVAPIRPLPATASAPSGSASAQSVHATDLTPAEAEALVRRTVTGSRPLLFPTTVAPSWRADVEAESDFFNVAYYSPDRTKRVTLAIVVSNIGEPTNNSSQAFPKFHGDRNSLYQVQDKRQARGLRDLVWIEPGHPAPAFAAQGGVPYLLSSTGLTDAEFWAFANGLRAAR